MTQAIALKEMLERQGHEVVAVLAGSNQSRTLPRFFTEAFRVPVQTFSSPGFSLKDGRAISTLRSGLHLFRNLPTYRRSLNFIGEVLREVRPDLIVNFLEPLMGYFNLRRRTLVPTMAVAHHFMCDHPRYPRITGFRFQRLGMRMYVGLTGARATHLGLSFYEAPDLPQKRLVVCPPILRRQLFDLAPDPNGRHLLVYLLNHGYASEIAAWARQHPDVPVHCFYDKPGAPAEESPLPNLTFHALHGEKYLRLMASARGVVCTAGFESISEAAYLGKALLMVPVQNHVEQHINSLDAQHAGLGVREDHFLLSRLLEPRETQYQFEFRKWVLQAESVAVRAAETAAGLARSAAISFSKSRLPVGEPSRPEVVEG